MKTILLHTVIILLVATMTVVCVPLCFSQENAQQLIDFLRQNEKLVDPEMMLKDFEDGKETIRVVVKLKESIFDAIDVSKCPDAAYEEAFRARVWEAQERVLNRLAPTTVRIKHRFWYLFGFSADVTLEGLKDLAELDDVVSIREAVVFKPHLAQGIPLMNASGVRNTYDGYGVSIAICDTGIDYTHPMLGGGGFPNDKVIGGYDVGDDDADPMDEEGHGTCCAGIAAGDLGSVGDYIGGVAPRAKLYAVKITAGGSGSCTDDDIIAAWRWCYNHRNDDPHNPIVAVSTSFGGGYYQSPCNAYFEGVAVMANMLLSGGIIVLASSGNEGYCDGTAAPACVRVVDAVGAVYDANVGSTSFCISEESCNKYSDSGCGDPGWACDDVTTGADLVTCYSNTADFVEFLAPSSNTYTTDIVGAGGYDGGDYFDSFAGTSAACPYVAGAAACLQTWARKERGAFLSPAEVRERLASRGDPITDTKNYHIDITMPRINLAAAISSSTILHKEGAIYDTLGGWDVSIPPYSPGTEWTVDMEYKDDGSYVILHEDGATYDSSQGWHTNIYSPGSAFARGLELITVTLLNEDFESTFPPTGWSVVNNGGGDCVWQLNTDHGRPNYTGGAGDCADADSDVCGFGTTMDTELWTPALDLSEFVTATLSFRTSYNDDVTGYDYAEVDVSTDGGGSWANLLSWDESHAPEGPGVPVELDISPYCGNASVIIRFHYIAPEWHYWFEVDDVLITSETTTILHRDGALWNNDSGWLITTPPYYAGSDYAVDLECRTDGSYVILHKKGAVYDSASDWNDSTPPYYPAAADWAVDLELLPGETHYIILHYDGARWSTNKGWNLDSPPYYPGTNYAVDLEYPYDFTPSTTNPLYVILHKDGALYDSEIGWITDNPPYYPGSDWTKALETR